MQTTQHPVNQGQHVLTLCAQQPADCAMSLFNLVATEPPKQFSARRRGYRVAHTDGYQWHHISVYAEPVQYRRLSVSLRVRVNCVVHTFVHSRLCVENSLGPTELLTQEAENLFVWNTSSAPTSKFFTLLDNAEKEAIQ